MWLLTNISQHPTQGNSRQGLGKVITFLGSSGSGLFSEIAFLTRFLLMRLLMLDVPERYVLHTLLVVLLGSLVAVDVERPACVLEPFFDGFRRGLERHDVHRI